MYFQGITFWEIESYILNEFRPHCTKKIKFSIKDFFSECDQIRSSLTVPKLQSQTDFS